MCSRTVSDTANRLRHGSTLCSPTEKKSSAVLPMSKRSHVGNLRQIRKQGKGRSSKRKENRRLSFLLPPPWVRRRPAVRRRRIPTAESQRKTSRPLGANRLRQFVCPVSRCRKGAARWGEPACGSSCVPVSRCRKRSRLLGRTACGSSCAPVSRCRKGAVR